MAWVCKWRNLRGRVLFVKYLESVPSDARTPLARRAAIAATQRRIARSLGKSEDAVYAWRVGFRRPESEDREAIEQLTGVPATSWRTKLEQARAKRLRAAGHHSPLHA